MDRAYQCYIISPISGKTGEVCWLHVDLLVSLRQRFQSHSQSASHIVAAGALYWAALSVAERDPISSCQHGLGEAKNISGSWGDELWWTQCTWLKIEHDGTVWNNMNKWQKKSCIELSLTPSSKTHQDPHFSGELDVMTIKRSAERIELIATVSSWFSQWDASGRSHPDRNIPAMYRSDAALLQHLTCSFRQARKRNKMGGFKVVPWLVCGSWALVLVGLLSKLWHLLLFLPSALLGFSMFQQWQVYGIVDKSAYGVLFHLGDWSSTSDLSGGGSGHSRSRSQVLHQRLQRQRRRGTGLCRSADRRQSVWRFHH